MFPKKWDSGVGGGGGIKVKNIALRPHLLFKSAMNTNKKYIIKLTTAESSSAYSILILATTNQFICSIKCNVFLQFKSDFNHCELFSWFSRIL